MIGVLKKMQLNTMPKVNRNYPNQVTNLDLIGALQQISVTLTKHLEEQKVYESLYYKKRKVNTSDCNFLSNVEKPASKNVTYTDIIEKLKSVTSTLEEYVEYQNRRNGICFKKSVVEPSRSSTIKNFKVVRETRKSSLNRIGFLAVYVHNGAKEKTSGNFSIKSGKNYDSLKHFTICQGLIPTNAAYATWKFRRKQCR